MGELEGLLGDEKWEKALEAYGTPGNFADSSYIKLVSSENPADIPVRLIVAGGYARRAELMARQKEETEKRKSMPRRWTDNGSSCFLCDNAGQAKNIGNNALLPWDTYTNLVLMPNRYAAVRGHMLPTEKQHQPGILSISTRFLANSVELAEKYGIALIRNHPKAGMSIPGHDHFHAYPRNFETKDGEKVSALGLADCELGKTDFGEEVFYVMRTRFETLAFRGKKALENITRVVSRLEKNQAIFTMFYEPRGEADWNGVFFLTPHAKEVKGIGGHASYIGIATPEQEPSYTYQDFVKLPSEAIHLRGTFNWDGYF